MANGNVTINGGNVDYNQAKNGANASGSLVGGYGGAFYLTGGIATINGGSVSNNSADKNGGGFYVNAAASTSVTTIKGGATVANNTAVNGGGAYINQGQLVIQDAATSIANNTASTSGGGIYMANGTVTFTNATMQGNTAMSGSGGGLYLGNGNITVSGSTAAIKGNTALNSGGGVHVGSGNYTMTGGVIGGTVADGNSVTAGEAKGGGLFMGGGTATLTGGSVSGNTSAYWGGGVYMEGGTCTLTNNASIGGAGASYANSATYGGGIYSAGGSITVSGGHIDHNTAVQDGGGIYSNGPTATVTITKQGTAYSYMQYNEAINGGGIYANRGTVDFTDGYIQYNYASEAGGGMYVNHNDDDDSYGTLNMKGSSVLSRNHVPTGKKGGGVYLKGRVVVGESSKVLGAITAEDNFAHTIASGETVETYACDNATRNNIYLPDPEVRADHCGVITVVEGGIGTSSHVGFSVDHNLVPVIYCVRSATSWSYLDRFTTGTGHDLNTVVFDDTEHYLSVHYTNWAPDFDPDHVYLYGFWPEAVTALPSEGFSVDTDGNVTETRYETADGSLTLINKGYAILKRTFAGKDRILSESYYDVIGLPIASTDGYASKDRILDEKGNVLSESYFNPEGMSVLCKAGYARIEKTYDEAGQVIHEAWFDTD